MAKKQTEQPEPLALQGQIDTHSLEKPAQLDASDQAYLASLLRQQQAVQIAMDHFSQHITPRYQLAQGDSVTPDGQIVRKSL